jgi:tetratricopeptide (TPR) repeat protein
VDWLDRLTIAAITTLVLVMGAMLVLHHLGNRKNAEAAPRQPPSVNLFARQMELNKKLFGPVLQIQEGGQYADAITMLDEIAGKYPENPMTYVHMARIRLRQGRLAESIGQYRRAVEMSPDLVDNKTPFFIGRELKDLVTEGREKLAREKALKPGDATVLRALGDIYYLQRRLAGGCE